MQTDALHVFRGRAAPPVSPDALRHRGTLPEAPATTTPERPPQHLCYALPRRRGGETSERKQPLNSSGRRCCGREPKSCRVIGDRIFPVLQFCWQCEDVDRDMDFIMAVVRTIRSLRSDYKLTKTAADCKQTENSAVHHLQRCRKHCSLKCVSGLGKRQCARAS